MVGLVGRGEDLALVDVVDVERLKNLCLDKVPNPALRHDRNRHGLLNPGDHLGVTHPRDAPVGTDVGWNPFEGHHGDGAGVLGNHGLRWSRHVHDDAALEHPRQPVLCPVGSRLPVHRVCLVVHAPFPVCGRPVQPSRKV